MRDQPGFHERRKHERKNKRPQAQESLFHCENRLNAGISTRILNAITCIKMFPFPCACPYGCVRIMLVKTKRYTQTQQI